MTGRAFLNVETSLTGRRWIGPSAEEDRLAEAMAQQTHLPLALCHTLVKRGIPPDEAAAYLQPALRDLLPDPLTLRDMGPAAAIGACDRVPQSTQMISRCLSASACIAGTFGP